MRTFEVKIEGKEPNIHISLPLDDFLLDDAQMKTAKDGKIDVDVVLNTVLPQGLFRTLPHSYRRI